MNNRFTNINMVPNYVIALDSTGDNGLPLVNNENRPFPQVSNLVSSEGITLSKNVDNSITIGSTTTDNVTAVDISQGNIITLTNLDNSRFVPDGHLTNFALVVETSKYVDITGAISLQKPSGDPTGTLGSGQTAFFVNINYNFPPAKDYSGTASVGGLVGFYTEDNFVICTRNFTPSSNMEQLSFQVNTNAVAGSTLPSSITKLKLEFSLRYEKA